MNPHRDQFTWRPFRSADLSAIDLLDEKEIVLRDAAILHNMGESLDEYAFCGIAFRGEIPVMIGGWKRIDASTLRVFAIPTGNIFKHPLSFTKFVLGWISQLENLPGVSKIITLSVANRRIDRWMRTLGFIYESTHTQYADRQDYRLWSKTKVNGLWGHRSG